MSDINITIPAGASKRLLTEGKYCDNNIVITAEEGGIELPTLSNPGIATDLLENKQLIDANGEIIEGTMPNNGAMSRTMDGITIKSITIPRGYTSGGKVSLDDTIGNEVNTQSDLISQIKAKANSLPSTGSGGTSGNVFFGTVTSNASGIVTIPMPSFEPKQIMLWNVSVIDQHEETGDYSLVRYLCDGVMLCAVWSSEYGGWVAQYMNNQSGVVAIAQASATKGDYQGDQERGDTNIIQNTDSIIWQLGGDSNENGINDFTEVTFNYVITG